MIYPFLLVITDFIALLAAFTLAYILRVQIDSRPLVQQIEAITFIKVFVLLIPVWLVINGLLGLYTKPVYEKRLPELGRVIVGSFIGILVIIGFDFIRDETIFPARLVPIYAFFAAFILIALGRNILWLLRRWLFRYGYGVRGVMLIGKSETARELAEVIKYTFNSGYDIRAVVGPQSVVPKGFKGRHYSSLQTALDDLPNLHVHTIIQTEMYDSDAQNERIFMAVRNLHLQFKFIPAQSDFYTGKNTIEVLYGLPVISVHQTPLIGWGRITKRLMDIFLSLVVLLPALPIMLVLAIIIKMTDPKGPVIYKHKRVTRFGQTFYVLKMRSMYWRYSTGEKGSKKSDEEVFREMGRPDLAEEFAVTFKIKNDPRVMPIGRFMRKTSLDELPQLFNVLKGDLSLVGPRAMKQEEAARYRKFAGGDVVLSVKSGITGLWQVSGRSNLSAEDRVRLELYYVQNWSLWLDIKILAKTLYVVVKGTGAE